MDWIGIAALFLTVGTLLVQGGKLLKRFEDIAKKFEKYPPDAQDRRIGDLEHAVFGKPLYQNGQGKFDA